MNSNNKIEPRPGPIGVFDSGYGGLTILRQLEKDLPQYHYIYFGDNARSPYGNRSFETVSKYTLQAVKALFEARCNLVILACNTASAKALRSIQKNYLTTIQSHKRVLGVIRPTTEIIGSYSQTKHIGILGTSGTVNSMSYPIEIKKFFPECSVFQQACPLWVPLIENNEHLSEGADYFVKKYIDLLLLQSPKIDTIVLGCTHYPLLLEKIKKYLPPSVQVFSQSHIVSNSLKDYFLRNPDKEKLCSKKPKVDFFTSDDPQSFNENAEIFFGQAVDSQQLILHD